MTNSKWPSINLLFSIFAGTQIFRTTGADRGHKVIGVEVSPIACKAFFAENNISYKAESRGHFILFQSANITLWCGDFFSFPAVALDGITAVYDRAALIALPQDLRKKYVSRLELLLESSHAKNVEVLLISLECSKPNIPGPPFSVSASEVKSLYKSKFKIREVERVEDTVLPLNNLKFEGTRVFETVFSAQLKA